MHLLAKSKATHQCHHLNNLNNHPSKQTLASKPAVEEEAAAKAYLRSFGIDIHFKDNKSVLYWARDCFVVLRFGQMMREFDFGVLLV
jgi:hypothetical protein